MEVWGRSSRISGRISRVACWQSWMHVYVRMRALLIDTVRYGPCGGTHVAQAHRAREEPAEQPRGGRKRTTRRSPTSACAWASATGMGGRLYTGVPERRKTDAKWGQRSEAQRSAARNARLGKASQSFSSRGRRRVGHGRPHRDACRCEPDPDGCVSFVPLSNIHGARCRCSTSG